MMNTPGAAISIALLTIGLVIFILLVLATLTLTSSELADTVWGINMPIISYRLSIQSST
jgi:hypothetical protein